MSKTLKTIQTISKVARIICKIVFIICVIGAVACLVSVILLAALSSANIRIDGKSISDIISESAKMPISRIALNCVLGALLCIVQGVIAYMELRYFTHEIEDGTPFTFHGSKEIFRLGIFTLISPFVYGISGAVIVGVFNGLTDMNVKFETGAVDTAIGIAFLFLSLIFKYGAELEAKARK